MGFTYDVIGGPLKAFNAHKHWISGWFDDAVKIEIDPLVEAHRFDLMAFTEYGMNVRDIESPVLAKLGSNVYLQYSLSHGYNRDVEAFASNKVTIVAATHDIDVSRFLAGLDVGESYSIDDFEGTGYPLVISVCSIDDAAAKTAAISVHLADGKQESKCAMELARPGARRTAVPSIAPTTAPTFRPTRSPISPSTEPTAQPTPLPSIPSEPIVIQIMSRPSSDSPSQQPSEVPSDVPSDIPSRFLPGPPIL